MNYYQRHLFFCVNQRDDGTACCADKGARALRDYAKQKLKQAGLHGPGHMRVNMAGCMGRCDEGPILVVYPEGIWYTYIDEHDIDEIIDEHLLAGRVVKRLRI